MSERGLSSRREADEYIERGWVYVDGARVEELGVLVFLGYYLHLSGITFTNMLK